MGATVAGIALKALAGGLFVLVFAALSQVLTPKRFAGVFSAAPSVALGSLIVTAVLLDVQHAADAASGMRVGAVAFAISCVVAIPVLRRRGAWWSALSACAVWALAATAGYLLVLT